FTLPFSITIFTSLVNLWRILLALFLHTAYVETLSKQLDKNLQTVKKALPAKDVLTFPFVSADGIECAIVYTDGMVNKGLLGDLIARPLSQLNVKKESERDQIESSSAKNKGGRVEINENAIKQHLLFPEVKDVKTMQDVTKEVLDGNALLLVDGLKKGIVVGAKMLPVRAVTEPPSDVAIKGPREGFIEDFKTNVTLLRKRLKSPDLRIETLRLGKRSDTWVSVCYLEGICDKQLRQAVLEKLKSIDVDILPDSSYVTALIAPRKHSVFRSVGTTEKPDVLAAKLSEGRIGVLVDGSPIALTLPFSITEDFQSSEDYFVSPFMATIFRTIRIIAVMVALFLPAFYVTTQLFKMQLLPLGLMLTIAKSVQELPFSPSMEMFVVLLIFEILKEASIRMPKYVGMSLSVVGALVLGEAAVSAGFLSTPTIIVVALSGICLYTVPNFVETGSVLRWFYLIVAGSFGPFGLVLAAAFTLYYLISADSFGMPPLAPFSPLVVHDLRDSIPKYAIRSLKTRPKIYRSKNKTRLREQS
ncbi:MAG: spore germination protein, partial [Clostridia bacterium]|nr:spore germination protein [Clostridia bacterium]